jgi:hypothetical protein
MIRIDVIIHFMVPNIISKRICFVLLGIMMDLKSQLGHQIVLLMFGTLHLVKKENSFKGLVGIMVL